MNNSKHFTSVRENNEGVDDNKCENYFMSISNVSSNMNKSFKIKIYNIMYHDIKKILYMSFHLILYISQFHIEISYISL